jgi:hypothetical protein
MKSVVKNAWISVFFVAFSHTEYVCVILAINCSYFPLRYRPDGRPNRDALCSVGDGTWIFIQLHSPAFTVHTVASRTFGALQVSTKTGCVCPICRTVNICSW